MVQSKAITKICLRQLPPDLTSEELLEVISPLPPHDFYKFHKGDPSLYPMNMTRAYINFPSFSDVMEFSAKFDGQVFSSRAGVEYVCQVEAAPSQYVPTPNSKEDSKEGTLDNDPCYLKFLKEYEEEPAAVEQINVDEYLQEVAQKEVERKKPVNTPLIDFIREKKAGKKHARMKKDDEKRRLRTEERRKTRAADRQRKNDRKKELIDSKNQNPKNDRNERVDGGGDSKEERKPKPEGGRVAARERRKKEAEERRKAKLAEKKRSNEDHDRSNEEKSSRRYSKQWLRHQLWDMHLKLVSIILRLSRLD